MTLLQRFIPHKTLATGLKLCQRFVHIPPYKEPDQYYLNAVDLNLIITKSRFVSFLDDVSSEDINSDKNECNESGSFILQLSTNLCHATYLVEPIWKRYSSEYQPTLYDIECMLNYYNRNESWTKGSYFIKTYILQNITFKQTMLTIKSWKYICEIALKAINKNECITLLDSVITHYKHLSKYIAWKEIVKILLIKRSFNKIVEYSPFICQYIIECKDDGLLDMIIHSFKIVLKRNNIIIKDYQINNVLLCIDTIYVDDDEKRRNKYNLLTQNARNTTSNQQDENGNSKWYVMDGNQNENQNQNQNENQYGNENEELLSISMDFCDENEQKECELISFKLNCLEIENDETTHQIKKSESYLSIYEWIFNTSSPHDFLYLFQTSYQYFLKQKIDSNIIWQYILLSLLKCQYKFNKNIKEFLQIINTNNTFKSINNNYAQFIVDLSSKYHFYGWRQEQHRDLQFDIIQFIKLQDTMFWSFDNLQHWLYQLMTVNNHNDENKHFVEYLFNLMVIGMLYNDSFQIRPQLRALLRFGSYYKLYFNSKIVFNDQKIRDYLNDGISNMHHPFHPFQFYTNQIKQYNENIKQDIKPNILLSDNTTNNEMEQEKQQTMINDNDGDIDDDFKKQQELGINVLGIKNMPNPLTNPLTNTLISVL